MCFLQALQRTIVVHKGERTTVTILLLHYFLVSAAVIAGKSARDALFLSQYGKSVLPLMYVANAVVIAAVAALFARMARRLPTRTLSTGSLALFAFSLLAISFRLNGYRIAMLYVWMEVIGTVAVMQAWSLAGDAFDPRQAKRLFGVIAAGGSIAATGGGWAVAFLASRYGARVLVLVVATVLGIAAGTSWLAGRIQAPRPRRRRLVTAGRIRFSPYVLSIATLIIASSVVSAIVQYKFQVAAASAHPERSQMLAFFGQFYGWTGAASLLTQLFLSRFLLARFGLIAGLAVLPLCFTVGNMWALLAPALLSVSFSRFSDLTFKFTLNNTSVEMLWLPVPPEERNAVKPLVSGAVKAGSEAATGVLMFALVNVAPAWCLSAFALGVCGVWMQTVVRLRGQYRSALASVIEKRQLSSEALRIDPRDPTVVAFLERALRSGDEAEQISALSFLDGFPVSAWSDILRRLYREGSTEVRDAVLRVTAKDARVIPDEWILASLRDGVAGSARIAVDRKIERAKPLIVEMLNSQDVANSVMAAAALLREGDHTAAQSRINDWLSDPDPRIAAQAMNAIPQDIGRIDSVRLRHWLCAGDSSAVRAALRVAGSTRDEQVLDAVIHCLAQPRCALQARITLRQLRQPDVVQSLTRTVSSESTGEPLRRGALRALSDYAYNVEEQQLGERVSTRSLNTYEEYAALLHSIGLLRALERSVTERVTRDLKDVTELAYSAHELRMQLTGDSDALLLHDYAEQQSSKAIAIVLRLAACTTPGFPVDGCLQAVHSADRAKVPYVLELLEASIPHEQARRLAPVLDVAQAHPSFQERHPLLPDEAAQRVNALAIAPDEWAIAVLRFYLARKNVPGMTAEEGMYSILEKTVYLKSSDVFGGIAAENLSRLAAIAEESSWPAGSIVFREGDPGDALYVVLSGSVRIVKRGVEIATLSKGACFGEMAVLDGMPRSADALVCEEALLLRIMSEEFYEELAENPPLMKNVIALLTRRLRDTNAKVAHTGAT